MPDEPRPSPSERFVWPPGRTRPASRAEPQAATPTAEPAEPSIVRPTTADAPPPPPARPRPDIPESGVSSATERHGWFSAIESVWLGRVRAPWRDRARHVGWSPDREHDYCPSCGQAVGPHEIDPVCPPDRAPTCSRCRSERPPWDRLVRLGAYEGELRDAIHEVKFARWRELGFELGRELGRSLRGALAAHMPGMPVVLVPMPTTFRRRLARGIDHTVVIARGVREIVGGRLSRPIRRLHRPSQVGLPSRERARNAAGSFRPRAGIGVPAGSVLILIDDILTTGATMTAASRSIRSLIGSAPSIEPEKTVSHRDFRVWAAVLGVTPVERSGTDA